jgi:S-(hydroxymethyl)glutathione dehydrogenase/alcohol dehydrogenase
VVAIDPVPVKQKKALEFGATHTFDSIEQAGAALPDLTWGRMAQLVVLTVGHIEGSLIQQALSLTAKGGQVVVTAMGHYADNQVSLNLFELTLLQKRVQGAIFGGTGPRTMIPELLDELLRRRLLIRHRAPRPCPTGRGGRARPLAQPISAAVARGSI